MISFQLYTFVSVVSTIGMIINAIQKYETFFNTVVYLTSSKINILVFFAKVVALLFVFIWVRFTLPRFRYDQLMRLGWVFFFEIALVNIFWAAAILALMPDK